MDPSTAPQFIALVILLALSAFFSSAETSLTTLSKISVRSLVEDGVKNAALVQKLIENPSKLLSTILIGNNIVNLSASSLATVLTNDLCTRTQLPVSASTAIAISTGILTLLVLLFGKIMPKTMATAHNERLALLYAKPIYALTIVLTPVIFIVNSISTGLLKLFHLNGKKKAAITENEFLTIIDVSHEEGVLEQEEIGRAHV